MVQMVLFAGVVVFVLFLAVEFWFYFEGYDVLVRRVIHVWEWDRKIEASVGSLLLIVGGGFLSTRSLRRQLKKANYFDR